MPIVWSQLIDPHELGILLRLAIIMSVSSQADGLISYDYSSSSNLGCSNVLDGSLVEGLHFCYEWRDDERFVSRMNDFSLLAR